MKPYSIWLPDFDITSGGIRVMYGLYGWLLTKGQVVIPNMTTEDNSHVSIYPEIVQGKPLYGETVVRYLLNEPGTMSLYGTPGPSDFPKSDLIYTFSKMFYKTDDEHTLFLPILDLNTFDDQKKRRTKTAFFVGKGRNQNKHPDDAVEITREFSQNQEELAILLNECDVLYSYDPVSAMTEISRLCGCRVVLYQEKYTKKQYELYEPGLNGMGIESDEKLDIPKFRTSYKALGHTFSYRLNQFITLTQKI